MAGVWTVFDRRRTDYRVTHDGLRSLLRYALAFVMLGYGLAKVSWAGNQFPTPADYHLNRTYGDSSPMGLVWTWMGASRAYTVFAGLGEVIGGLLLLSRRTATLGALVVFGVMTNVMMLNYCYDVPVKLYSTHLVFMAVLIMMPDFRRLVSFFLTNRAAPAAILKPPYVGPRSKWVYWLWKVAIAAWVGVMLVNHTTRQAEYLSEQSGEEQATSDALLMSRGYRWINEVPYNR